MGTRRQNGYVADLIQRVAFIHIRFLFLSFEKNLSINYAVNIPEVKTN